MLHSVVCPLLLPLTVSEGRYSVTPVWNIPGLTRFGEFSCNTVSDANFVYHMRSLNQSKAVKFQRHTSVTFFSLARLGSVPLLYKSVLFCCITCKGTDANGFPLREEFAKSCFETLLQFSFVNGTPEEEQRVDRTGKVSLNIFSFVLHQILIGPVMLAENAWVFSSVFRQKNDIIN